MLFSTELAVFRDADALAELRVLAMRASLEQLGRFDPQRARRRFLDSFTPTDTRKLTVDGKLVGFYVLSAGPAALTLSHLYLLPRFQGHGIGARVVQRAKRRARAWDMPLQVGALRGSRSNAFYLSSGFVKVREEQWDIHYQWC